VNDEEVPALASGVRRRIVEHLNVVADTARPGAQRGRSAAELAAYLDLHVTTVRFHLDQLVAGGYLVTAFERSTKVGRPRKLYAAPAVDESDAAEAQRHFQVLAALLAQNWPTGEAEAISAEEAGRRWAMAHADPDRAGQPPAATAGRWLAKVGDMVDQLEHWGYTPELSTSHGGRTVTIALHNCPFLALARQRPDVVCGVHHGLIHGALEHIGERDVAIDVRPFVGPTRCLVKVSTSTPFTTNSTASEGAPA